MTDGAVVNSPKPTNNNVGANVPFSGGYFLRAGCTVSLSPGAVESGSGERCENTPSLIILLDGMLTSANQCAWKVGPAQLVLGSHSLAQKS